MIRHARRHQQWCVSIIQEANIKLFVSPRGRFQFDFLAQQLAKPLGCGDIESPVDGRLKVGHEGRRQPSKSAPQELHFGANHDPGYRMPRVVSDLVAAMPVHLAIIDGVESLAGAELPRPPITRPVKPGVLIAGLNPVCTDAVATAVMGYNPRGSRGEPGFPKCDNQLVLAEQRGLGTCELKRIDVRGVSIEQALYKYDV